MNDNMFCVKEINAINNLNKLINKKFRTNKTYILCHSEMIDGHKHTYYRFYISKNERYNFHEQYDIDSILEKRANDEHATVLINQCDTYSCIFFVIDNDKQKLEKLADEMNALLMLDMFLHHESNNT